MKKILGVIFLSILILSLNIFNQNTDNFSENIITTDDITLYIKNNKYEKIGTISKGINLSLEKTNDKFYKIKNTDYYIKSNKIKESDQNNLKEYIPYNENIITTDNVILYKNNARIEINKQIESKILIKNKNSYIIEYLNDYYEVKKENVKEIKETKNTDIETALYVPVLYLSKISDEMKYNDLLNTKKLESILNYLKENNYNFLTLEDYKEWVSGKINISKNSILLVSEEETKFAFKNDNINFNLNNKASKINEYNAYKIDNNINMSNLIDILSGNNLIIKNINDEEFATYVPVLNYHFFYDSNSETCNENICLDISKFEEELQYLNENNYKTLTMQEYVDWYNGLIEVPKKSVLLTIDDGAFGTDTHLPRLLTKYQINATLFLITAWWPKEKYVSPYLEIESHGYDIHRLGNCGKARITCLSKEEVIDDLNKSINLLNTKLAFCYPFYTYNETSKLAIKEARFEVAFAGGGYSSSRKSQRYALPRYPIYKTITMNEFIKMVN